MTSNLVRTVVAGGKIVGINEFTNPSAEVSNTANVSTALPGTEQTLSRSQDHALIGSWSFKITIESGNTRSFFQINHSGIAIAEGETRTLSLRCYIPSTVSPAPNDIQILLRDDIAAVTYVTQVVPIPPVFDEWFTLEYTHTVPAGRTLTRNYWRIRTPTVAAPGNAIYFDGWSTGDGNYFDGDTPPDDTYEYYWAGAAHGSQSYRTQLIDNYEYAYGPESIVLNTSITPGVPFVDIEKVTGLDTPPLEPGTHDKDSGHGGFTDAEFTEMRTIIFDGTVYGHPNEFEPVHDDLTEEYFPTNVNEKLWIKHPGVGLRYILCKPLGYRGDVDTGRRTGTGACQIQFIAEDGRKYRDNDDVVTPLNTDAQVTNEGWAESFPVFEIPGPCTVTSIENVEWAEELAFDTGIAVSSGQTLKFDAGDRSITKDGVDIVTDRSGGSKWPRLHKGTQRFRVNTSSGAVNATIKTKSAWW